jgi:hypothetical protein
MRNRKQKQKKLDLQLDPEELRAKQSVRTTFRLTEKTINLLKVAAKHLGIKQKTLLDQLLEDEKALNLLADDAITHARNENKCRPKTLVLSQKALDLMEKISYEYDIPRDFLIELSVARLASYIDSLAQTHATRRALLGELDQYSAQITDMAKKAGKMLEDDDIFRVKLSTLSEKMVRQVEEIKKTVKSESEFAY